MQQAHPTMGLSLPPNAAILVRFDEAYVATNIRSPYYFS
jgi:hypothetical protein